MLLPTRKYFGAPPLVLLQSGKIFHHGPLLPNQQQTADPLNGERSQTRTWSLTRILLLCFLALAAALAVFARLFLARKERGWAFYCLASAVLVLLIFFAGFSNVAWTARTLRLATFIGWMAASIIAIKFVTGRSINYAHLEEDK